MKIFKLFIYIEVLMYKVLEIFLNMELLINIRVKFLDIMNGIIIIFYY